MYKDLVKGKDGFDHIESQYTKTNNSNTLLKIVILLLFLQITRILLKESLVYFLNDNLLNNYISSTVTIVLLLIFMLYKSKKESVRLNIFSYMNTLESKSYYIVVTISIILLVLISNWNTYSNLEIIYSSIYIIIVIPIYEEIIFRSYVWNKLEEEYKDGFKTYLVTTTLFSLWQIGYIDIIAMNVGYNSLWIAVLMKCSLMLSYGFFIGYFRYKLKNTYSSILIHSFINIFRI